MLQFYLRSLLLAGVFVLGGGVTQGQQVVLGEAPLIRRCGGTFYDSGGPDGSHAATGRQETITLCSDGADRRQTHVELDFTSLSILGTLTIYDGESDAAPVLREVTEADNGSRIRVTASAGNTSGCLTVTFVSRGSQPGWTAGLRCVVPCQPVLAELVGTEPAASPSTEGYVNLCLGNTVTLTGRGRYPESGTVYEQDNALSSFFWDLGDGTLDTGQSISHTYLTPGGYLPQLRVVDQEGCRSSNQLLTRIRVSGPPTLTASSQDPIALCPGESIRLGTMGAADPVDVRYEARVDSLRFQDRSARGEQVSIPETAGEERVSALRFGGFGQGQVVRQGADISSICLSIEHDYIGDLSIWVQCPNGRRVDLLTYDPQQRGATGQYFGSPTTDPGNTLPGEAGNYCWSGSARETVAEVAQGVAVGSSMPELNYLPEGGEGFGSLATCSYNGEWTLHVLDQSVGNGGTIFSWTVNVADEVAPPTESFLIPLTAIRWLDDGYATSYTPDRVVATGGLAGTTDLGLRSTDSLGCTYDTVIQVATRSPFAAECFSCPDPTVAAGQDTTLCVGASFVPKVGIDTTTFYETVRYANRSRQPYLGETADYSLTVPITVEDQLPATFAASGDQLKEVCFRYAASRTLYELQVDLVGPDGSRLALVRPGQVTSTSLDRCFTVDDLGDRSAFGNSPANGQWVLAITHPDRTHDGVLEEWTLGLERQPPVTYSWTPGRADFSCTDCLNPTVTPTAPGTYTLTATSADGCTASGALTIRQQDITVDFSERTTTGCAGENDASIRLTRTAGSGPLTYDWSNGAATRDLLGVAPGEYGLTVTAANGCARTFSFTAPAPDSLVIEPSEITPVSCFGTATGAISSTTSGGTAPYRYRWNRGSERLGGNADRLRAGTYRITVTDAKGCVDTTSILISQPSRLVAPAVVDAVSCRTETSGAVAINPTGGTAPYRIDWEDGPTDFERTSLAAGRYGLTISDANGCVVDTVVRVEEPPAFFSAVVVDEVGPCTDKSNGRATVVVTGTAPGSYRWSSGETTATAVALPPGEGEVTVTDENGCTRTLSYTLVEQQAVEPEVYLETDNRCDSAALQQLSLRAPYAGYRWSSGDTTASLREPLAGQSYTVTVTTDSGCTGTDEFTYRPLPPVDFSVDITPVTCFGTRTGALEVVNVRPPIAGEFTYAWDINANQATTARVSELLAGEYSVTVTNGSDCSTSATVILPSPPLLALQTRPRDISCFGAGDGRIATTVTGGTEPYRYRWSNGGTGDMASELEPGDYTLTVTDAQGCQRSDTLSLTSPGAITVEATTESGICGGSSEGRIAISAEGGREPYRYALNNSLFNVSPTYLGLSEGDYQVTVRDAQGCEARTTVRVEDGPGVSLLLPPDTTIVFGDSVQLGATVVGATGQVDYFWEGSDPGTLACPTCAAPVVRPAYNIDYRVLVIDSLGCEATGRVRVSVEKIREVAVPSAFTPNGDGENDRLLVHGRPGTEVVELTVFDRWGNVTYQDREGNWPVNAPTRGWDGNAPDGEPYSAGVYLYRLTVRYEDASRETLSGQTTLLR